MVSLMVVFPVAIFDSIKGKKMLDRKIIAKVILSRMTKRFKILNIFHRKYVTDKKITS